MELDLGEEEGKEGAAFSFSHEDPPKPLPPDTTPQDPGCSAPTVPGVSTNLLCVLFGDLVSGP